MPPLHGAITLPKVHDVAVMIGDELDLDVPRALDVALEIDAGVAEGGLSLRGRLLQGAFERKIVGGDAHAAAPAAGRRLDQNRKADLMGQPNRLRFIRDQSLAPRHDRNAGIAGQPPGLVLVPQAAHRLGRGADEVDVAGAADFVEMGVLGKKPVAGMDRLHIADFGRADHAIDPQVAIGRLGRANAKRRVGQAEIVGVAVGLAVNRDRLDPQLAAGANHPQGDLTAIGNQDAIEHFVERNSFRFWRSTAE